MAETSIEGSIFFLRNNHKDKTFERGDYTVPNKSSVGPVELNDREKLQFEVLQYVELINVDEVKDYTKDQLVDLAEEVGVDVKSKDKKADLYEKLSIDDE